MLQQLANTIVVHYLDNDSHKSHCEIRYAPAVDLAVLLGLLPSWVSLIAPLTSAICTGVELVVKHKETSPIAYSGTTPNKRGASMFFHTSAASDYVVRIPAFKPIYYLSSGPYAGIQIDATNIDVFNFIDFIGRGTRDVSACDLFANDIEDYVVGFREDY